MNSTNPLFSLRSDNKRIRTIKFLTLGCKVNQYDTQSMRENFLASGFKELKDGIPADTYVINTCTVTHRADSESLNLIRRAKRENPRARIIVAGCLTRLDRKRIMAVDENCRIAEKTFQGISDFEGRTRAFLKIQEGCDNFCSYCKVPFVRGRSRSKPLDEIVKEAKDLAAKGFKEIVLTGICLGAYGRDLEKKIDLIEAIKNLEKIEGISRIRLSSIEASDVTDKLINKIAVSVKLCRHLHIPIQSGDDCVLKRMNRRYSALYYQRLISKIKRKVYGIAITTDVLVGFPGENEENFINTIKLIKGISPLRTHIFPYSAREHTAAFTMGPEISRALIGKRTQQLRKIAAGCELRFKRKFINRDLLLLIEGRCRKYRGYWEGYTDNYIKVLLDSKSDLTNEIVTVRIRKIEKDYAFAQLTDKR